MPRLLRPKTLLNPMSRLALATFAWNHRHEVMRWGRTLYDQVVGRTDVSVSHAVSTGRLLFAIAGDDELRNAPQLRKVTMTDGNVDLQVDETWERLPRLLAKVRGVKGVANVTLNGRTSQLSLADAAAT